MGKVAITPFVAGGDFNMCSMCGRPCDGEDDARLHCYREHAVRLHPGGNTSPGRGRVDMTDINAEVRGHIHVVEAAMDAVAPALAAPVEDDMRADMALMVMRAVLKWDRRVEPDFAAFLTRTVRDEAEHRQLEHDLGEKP